MDVVHDRAPIIVEEEDRISNLPNEIIHQILSFLDMKYAVQTSTLSKKWKHVWTSMPHLNLNSQNFGTLPQFAKFVKDALSHRNHHTDVSTVKLSFRGASTVDMKSIVKYAYLHNVRQLNMIWSGYYKKHYEFPQCFFISHTLRHLTLEINQGYRFPRGRCMPTSAWDFPALETLSLRHLQLGDDGDNKSLNLFSKCVNLKDLTLHNCSMCGLNVFIVCAPRLCNLTITDPHSFPKVFNVVAPQLENFTASVMNFYSKLLLLSTEDLNSLQKVNLSMQTRLSEKEKYAPGLQDLFQKLCRAKYLILDNGIIELLSACLEQLSDESCPFNNLKCLKQKDRTPIMPIEVINYLLESSPSATFIMDVPQKRTRKDVDKGTMAKKASNVIVFKVQQKISREEVDKGTMAEKALSYTDQFSYEPSPFNNLKCLNQTDHIPRTPIEVKNQLLESSPSATFNMDLPQVPHKRSRQEAENGTMANTLAEKEKQQTESVDEEKRMLEAKLFKQDEVIAEKKAMLEAMKVQHEKKMLEAKIQEKVIAEQKVMLDTLKLQNDEKMLEEKIQRQDKIIAEQKAMLEAMKLQIETELGNNDS